MIVQATEVGMNAESIVGVESLFNEQIRNGLQPGAAMAVYRHGKLVLDLWCGISNTDTGDAVTEDTMFVLMSSTKPLAAACMVLLKERGKLAYDDRVTQYWPEFGKNGKESVTIRQVLTHTAGIPETPEDLTWDKWIDWDTVVRAIARTSRCYRPSVKPDRPPWPATSARSCREEKARSALLSSFRRGSSPMATTTTTSC